MASLEHDTLADVPTVPVEARTEEQTSETKPAGGPAAEGAAETDGGKLALSSPGPASTVQALTPATASSANGATTVAHPKKFSAVNINKKFLEKTGSAAPTAQPAAQAAAKTSGASLLSKPALQTGASHSRLVTTKLTAGPSGVSNPGPGWSRPSSTTPQHPNPVPEASSAAPTPAGSSGAPQLPVAGKVIQPQLRAAAPQAPTPDASSSKPVWRTQRPVAPSLADSKVQNDFPTAAEATLARSTSSQPSHREEAEDKNLAKKQAIQEQVDAFRGVHLDPNAHHWDEMEGDDDDFLDGVVEFGDGKQYKIEPAPSVSDPSGINGRHEADSAVNKDNRFADDFDRSWPRSATSANLPNQRDLPPHTAAPPSGRTLFNERSNRLEHVSPSVGSHRDGPPHLSVRKDSRSSPIERKFSNDGAGHTPSQGFQLLQKPAETPPYRSRGVRPGALHDVEVKHDSHMPTSPRPPHSAGSQSSFSGKDTLPPSMGRMPSNTGRGHDSGPDFLSRRLSNMGPPPLPFDRSKDHDRAPPPHLPHGAPPMARSPSVASTRRDSISSNDHRAGLPPPSPRIGLVQSPVAELKNVVATPEYEEVSKAAMHSAAEQARLRRQQEEEEREKAKERARRKAAELEAKMTSPRPANSVPSEAVSATVSEKDVLEAIEDAVKGVTGPVASPSLQQSPSSRGSARPPTLTPMPKPILTTDSTVGQKPSVGATNPAATGSSPAQESVSWRRRTSVSQSQKPEKTAVAGSEPAPAPHIASAVEPYAVKPGEVLEEVNFSDMDKFVGAEDRVPVKSPVSPTPSHQASALGTSRSGRPVASDFFHDDVTTPAKAEPTTWRRKAPEVVEQPAVTPDAPKADLQRLHLATPSHRETPLSPRSGYSHDLPPRPANFGHTSPTTVSRQPSHHGIPRSPRTSAFREAPMSALDDALSRIKGALDGMQAHEPGLHASRSLEGHSREAPALVEPAKVSEPLQPPKDVGPRKWLPPALRARPAGAGVEEPQVTSSERPSTPKPAWNAFAVRLPQQSPSLAPLPKKHDSMLKNNAPPFRWDIMTWNPPVEGMGRRDLSINDVLFKRLPMTRGVPNYSVKLPSLKPSGELTAEEAPAESGVKVNLPVPQGTSGKQRELDGDRPRHQGSSTPDHRKLAPPTNGDSSLNTVSRSPPPAPPSGKGNPSVSSTSTRISDASKVVPTSVEDKVPAGASVGFYREPATSPPASDVVSFTVVSEIDEKGASTTDRPSAGSKQKSAPGRSPAPRLSALPPPIVALVATPQAVKSSSDAHRNELVATASKDSELKEATLPKVSAVRGPDPEHLKAVWSQASHKADISASNSLEGIADDLTALQPFTLQDVKSDGGTPPLPPPAGTLRMSLSEVTRAFQQVPTSTSATESVPSSTPPPASTSSHQPARRPSYGPTSAPSPSMRPVYPHYSAPVMSSPSSSMMYPQMVPSPGPRPMQLPGTPQQYPQPMWIPVPPGTAPPTPAGMVRTLSSPYGAPVVAYSPSGHPPAMYPAGAPPPGAYMHPPHPQQGGPQQGQLRAMQMLSPMMQHAAMPMYASNPVLVHAQPYPSPMTPGQPHRPLPPGAHTPRTGPPPLPYGQVPQSPYHRPW